MKETDPLWISIGLVAQAAFSARFLLQWILSERARQSLLPKHFWLFSVAGAVLLLAYAAHQRDMVISAGQIVGLAIYLRNIQLHRHGTGQQVRSFVWLWLGLCTVAISVGLFSHGAPISTALQRSSTVWLMLGFAGQTLFTGRFVVQLYFSERAARSVNPIAFWYLSMSGSLLLLAYALSIGDLVIILGQSFGIVVYLRNLALLRRHAHSSAQRASTGASNWTAVAANRNDQGNS